MSYSPGFWGLFTHKAVGGVIEIQHRRLTGDASSWQSWWKNYSAASSEFKIQTVHEAETNMDAIMAAYKHDQL